MRDNRFTYFGLPLSLDCSSSLPTAGTAPLLLPFARSRSGPETMFTSGTKSRILFSCASKSTFALLLLPPTTKLVPFCRAHTCKARRYRTFMSKPVQLQAQEEYARPSLSYMPSFSLIEMGMSTLTNKATNKPVRLLQPCCYICPHRNQERQTHV